MPPIPDLRDTWRSATRSLGRIDPRPVAAVGVVALLAAGVLIGFALHEGPGGLADPTTGDGGGSQDGTSSVSDGPDVLPGECIQYRIDENRQIIIHEGNAGSANGKQGVVSRYNLVAGDVVEHGVLVGTGELDRCLEDAFPCSWNGGQRSDIVGGDWGESQMAAIFGFVTPDDDMSQGTHGSRWTLEVYSYAKTADGTYWLSDYHRPVVVYAHNTPGGRYEPGEYCDVLAEGLVP